MGQEGWGTAYNSIEYPDDYGNLLTKSIVKYDEQETVAESKVGDLES